MSISQDSFEGEARAKTDLECSLSSKTLGCGARMAYPTHLPPLVRTASLGQSVKCFGPDPSYVAALLLGWAPCLVPPSTALPTSYVTLLPIQSIFLISICSSIPLGLGSSRSIRQPQFDQYRAWLGLVFSSQVEMRNHFLDQNFQLVLRQADLNQSRCQ